MLAQPLHTHTSPLIGAGSLQHVSEQVRKSVQVGRPHLGETGGGVLKLCSLSHVASSGEKGQEYYSNGDPSRCE